MHLLKNGMDRIKRKARAQRKKKNNEVVQVRGRIVGEQNTQARRLLITGLFVQDVALQLGQSLQLALELSHRGPKSRRTAPTLLTLLTLLLRLIIALGLGYHCYSCSFAAHGCTPDFARVFAYTFELSA